MALQGIIHHGKAGHRRLAADYENKQMIEDGPHNPLECDVVHIFSQRCMESKGSPIPTMFLVDSHNVGGDVIQIHFESVATLAIFLREMTPQKIWYHLHKSEDHAALEYAMLSAGEVQPEAMTLH